MTALSRTITTSILDWRGIIIRVTFERQSFVNHLQVESVEPQRCPLSISATGYVSRYLGRDAIPDGSDPATFVESWLDDAAKARHWGHMEMEVRQLALL